MRDALLRRGEERLEACGSRFERRGERCVGQRERRPAERLAVVGHCTPHLQSRRQRKRPIGPEGRVTGRRGCGPPWTDRAGSVRLPPRAVAAVAERAWPPERGVPCAFSCLPWATWRWLCRVPYASCRGCRYTERPCSRSARLCDTLSYLRRVLRLGLAPVPALARIACAAHRIQARTR